MSSSCDMDIEEMGVMKTQQVHYSITGRALCLMGALNDDTHTTARIRRGDDVASMLKTTVRVACGDESGTCKE